MSINITKAVIHILDRESEEPLLNDFELDLEDEVQVFLEKHIHKALQDDNIRKCNFKPGMNIMRDIGQYLHFQPSTFLESSKEIARQLFRAMKTNSSISSTDLVICLLEEEGTNRIAVLKMDYSPSYIHEVQVLDDRFKISIRKNEVSLPGMSQKIQKCAFIHTCPDAVGYDMLVLDNQINAKNEEEPVAQFFLHTFLNAELLMDDTQRTKIFKKETENWIRQKSKEGEDGIEKVREYVNNTIREEEEIDLETFTRHAFGAKQYLYDDFKETMKEKGLEEERFKVDRDWVENKLSRIRLKTDSNIEITLNYEDLCNKEHFEVVGNPDGTRTILIKNIISMQER